MRVDLYTVCWNEADFLPFFFRHYDPWVDRYVVYDDGSTDGSAEMLAQHPRVELRRFHRSLAESFVMSHTALQDSVWKESRGEADWVVVTAIDEFLHMKTGLNKDLLATCTRAGVTAIPALGYEMISASLPDASCNLIETVTVGAYHQKMCKLSLFDPVAVHETRFAPGRHGARPEGRIAIPQVDELMLCHYRYLGFERTLLRNLALNERLGEIDRKKGWGKEYGWHRDRLVEQWQRVESASLDLAAPSFDVRRDSPLATRWWRRPDDAGQPRPWPHIPVRAGPSAVPKGS